jgi:hypothetical protein
MLTAGASGSLREVASVTEPYLRWPEHEREQITDEYRGGVGIRALARRYHKARTSIAALLRSQGILRGVGLQKGGHVVRLPRYTRHPVTPQIRQLVYWLYAAKQTLGHVPNEAQIGNILEEIREYNGGMTKIRKEAAADD